MSLQAASGIVGTVAATDMTGRVVGATSATNMTRRIIGATSADVTGGIVTGATMHGASVFIFFPHAARMPDAMLCPATTAVTCGIVSATSPALPGSTVTRRGTAA